MESREKENGASNRRIGVTRGHEGVARDFNRSTGSRGRAAMNIEQENQSAREGQVFIDSGDHRVATFLELTGTRLACEERK